MSVPKTPMNEDHGTIFGKNDVRLARQVRSVQPEPKPLLVKQTSNDQLGFGVLATNTGHHPAARGGIYNICHAKVNAGVIPIALWAYLSAVS
jgi:hypothetical protein